MIAYFTGVRPGEAAGHHCYAPGWRPTPRDAVRSPWAAGYDVLLPLSDNGVTGPIAWPEIHERGQLRYIRSATGHSDGGQTEGVPRVVHTDGWTLLFLWDRSADPRGGSCAGFAFNTVLDVPAALTHARVLFPGILERVEAHLGRSLADVREVPTPVLLAAARESTTHPVFLELFRRLEAVTCSGVP